MEVALLASSCIPEDAILSVRAGTVRRQAGIRSGRPFRFPKIGPEENPLKIDVLKQIATTYLVLKPEEDQYKVTFSGGPEAAGMTCEVEIKASDGSAPAPAEEHAASGEESESAKEARDYLESHQILQFVQALLQTVVKERPADPYAYMARHFMSGYEPLDQKAPKTAPREDEALETPASPMAPMLMETTVPEASAAVAPAVEAVAAAVAEEAAAPGEAAAAEELVPQAEEEAQAEAAVGDDHLAARVEPERATTSAGEPILRNLPICVPKVLLPQAEVDLTKWACVACDQFTSEPEYWSDVEALVGDAPSSLNLIFPEIHLSSVSGGTAEDDAKRIESICAVMRAYAGSDVFKEEAPAFIALDRATECVPSRKGLVMAVDLEEYNYGAGVATLIRPTEMTIVSRLPPRIAIRENAPLELPHIIMIIDDPDKTVIEPLFADAGLSEEKYSIELMKGGGSVRGFRVTEEGTDHVERSMTALYAREMEAAAEAGRAPALILIGDGNHSLATAKSCWETLKSTQGVGMDHPQRYALVELQNLHDEGVVFEPIHRILIGAGADELQAALEAAWGCAAVPLPEEVPMHSVILVRGPDPEDRVMLEPPQETLPVVSMSKAVDAYLSENPGVSIDYVHGEQAVVAASTDGAAVGLLLPSLDKTRFLETLHAIGTLPRKAFSMGEAEEKRFYVEARSIQT